LRIYIKYMVSLRCKMIVKEILSGLGFHAYMIELGEADIEEQIQFEEQDRLRLELRKVGLELLENKKSEMTGKIRNIIEDVVQHSQEPLSVNLSVYLVQQLHHDYTYLANLFSEGEGLTIEKFVILKRIQSVKKFLTETKLTLGEIAFRMNYSSEAHLSSQFKKIAGLTPTQFRKNDKEKF
jgi:YesN/AraC family two-component response regulator